MSALDLALIVLSVAGAVAALRVVTTPNVVHGALFLVVALSAVAGVFLVLGAEFVAWVQVLIYVGAIVVLLLFALMLTKAPIGREALDNQQRGLASVVGLVVFGGITWLLWNAFGGAVFTPVPASTAQVGALIFDRFVLPFEVVSMLLLAALIGAVVISRKDER